ncbi:phage tail sheath family protein [Mucilaginibacter flavus]|uniref:phage tail sheath family protein n=1 Tax=Mucilaginibacter flavus TaxID=931504 RepID=UPI0025B3F336|nr:phage tail sheath C-terminal domain-containing protein [Mucilaginibacter flavus]MDN3581259.1 phage tail sheath C-terminal domain-containing protein [Mucilaginibacter flavus]
MANYRSPGVYVEEISTLPPSIAEVESAVPAFIGYTQIATNLATDDLAGVPTPINSMADYIQYFGGPDIESAANLTIAVDEQQSGGKTTGYTAKLTFTNASLSKHILYHAVKLYFANGGTRCYIVSVGKYTGSILEADLEAGLTTLGTTEGPTILLCPEAAYSPTPNTFNEAMLLQASTLGDRFAIIDTATTTVPKSTSSVASDTGATIGPLPAGQPESSYGAVYYPFLQTSYNYQFDFDAHTITTYTVNGAVPNPASPNAGATLGSLKTTASLLYNAILTQYQGYFITLPPSAAIAGVYCNVDATRGVWKAPANVSLNAVNKAVVSVTRGEQDLLNVNDQSGKSVNAILNSPNFGTLVMGARTLDGNDNEWRYINVRRFFITVEQSIKNSTASFVFEPNTAATWVKVQAMISNYLFLKWRDGALAGAKPDQAYFVNVGLGSTMTSFDILEGKMIIEIGMAVARPAEFVVLRFEQMLQTS